MCRSQSSEGQYGCEVWLNPDVVLGSHGSLKFKVCRECLSILSAKPRSIVVSLVVGPFSCSLVSLHAPHSTSPQFNEWWDDFVNIWGVATNNCEHVLCGADLNYAFGRYDVYPCVGPINNVGKSLRHPVSSRVMMEILGCKCNVASTFR